MGWTFQERSKGYSHDEWFADKLRKDLRILASTTVGDTYAAVVENAEGKRDVFVSLIMWVPKDTFNFGYKDVPAEPGYAIGTKKMVDLLLERDDLAPSIANWAELSRRRLETLKWRRSVKDGDTVTLAQPLSFTFGDGHTEKRDTFVMRKRPAGRRLQLTPTDGAGQAYRFRVSERHVTKITRGDGTVETEPILAYADEDAYVKRVSDAWWAEPYGEHRHSAFAQRYGHSWISDVEWCARQEFRQGNLWDTLDTDVAEAAKALAA